MDYTKEYINKIKSGELVVGQLIKRWYLEHIEPIIEDKDEQFYYDPEDGLRFINFSEKFCRQSKGDYVGKLLVLDLFQKAKWQSIFGIKWRSTGTLRFMEIFDVRGRKNGKSTEHSALGLFMELNEKGAEVYVAATVYAQARRIWDDAVYMVDNDPYLKDAMTHKVFPQCILSPKKGSSSTFKVLSSNVGSFDGLNSSCVIIDEAHALSRSIYDILKQSTSSRSYYLISIIGSAGFERGGLFDDTREYCINVINWVITDYKIFPLLYELDAIEEMYKESCWIKANPGLGTIKKIEALRDNISRMKEDPNFANTVKVKDFNIIGIANKAWLDYETINNPKTYSDEFLETLKNRVVIGGFDLSRTGDLTCFNTLIPLPEKKELLAIPIFFATERFLKQQIEEKNSKVPWGAWLERGFVRICGTDLIDYHDISNHVMQMFREKGWIYQRIGYDRYSAQYLIDELDSMGFTKNKCLLPVAQGAKTLSIPMQTLESHLRNKVLVYQNNPVLKWMFTNVELVQDRNGNYMPKKMNDTKTKKIDGVATLLNCYVELIENYSYYMGEDFGKTN